MTVIARVAIGSTAVAMALAAAAGASSGAAAGERPRGVVESCSTAPGLAPFRAFTSRWNLVVGPLALKGAGVMLPYAVESGGNKLFVFVEAGHRVTLELSPHTRRNVGLVFGPPRNAGLRGAGRAVTFVACRAGEPDARGRTRPATGWVGFLLATSARCVPLRVWVDDEPSPRRAVVRFGVRTCD